MDTDYTPLMPKGQLRRIEDWHTKVLKDDRRDRSEVATCLGREFVIPPSVFLPKETGLWQTVAREVRGTDKVLDLGTGCGVNAIFAAAKSPDVTAVDINPEAVEITKTNARANGVSSHVRAFESDLFSAVNGSFDLILFDPPFWWFKPVDMWDRSSTDENYQTLKEFFQKASHFLKARGRILMYFGDSGDILYLSRLIDDAGLAKTVLRQSNNLENGLRVKNYTYRLTRRTV